MPTREECEALIAGYDKLLADVPSKHTYLAIGVTVESLRELVRMARLGAKVAAPSEAEVKHMCDAFTRTLGPARISMRAALQALKDSQ